VAGTRREAALPVAEPGPEVLRRTEQRAVVLQLERLMDYPMVRERVEARQLSLHGWHYVIEDGEVHVFDVQRGASCRRPTHRTPAPGLPPLRRAGGMSRITLAADDQRWRPSRLLTAPHRLGFFGAALMLALSALWWAGALAARHAGVTLPWAVPPPAAHGLVMAMGFMPLFIVGFLFTAGPKWLGLPEVPALALVRPVASMLAGWVLALAGFHLSAGWRVWAWPWWLAAGARWCCASGCWCAAALWPTACTRRRSPRAGVVGALALWGATLGLALDDITTVRVATQMALWGCLAPTFAAVSHRMIPFFTASALPMLDSWRPNWLLGVMLAVLTLGGAGAVAEGLWWPLPPALRWARWPWKHPPLRCCCGWRCAGAWCRA